MFPRWFHDFRRVLGGVLGIVAVGAFPMRAIGSEGGVGHVEGVREAPPPVAAPVESMVVYGRAETQLDVAAAASEGRLSGADLALRPMGRVGELLEAVPGLIATQHSGPGKSNQLFLRGFNLDHGTDFAVHFDGVPINFRSHGHGQGYLDLNFLIPELVESIDFRKGPYRADVGDFASAGASFLKTRDRLDEGIASLELGEDRFLRALVATNVPTPTGYGLVALEARRFEDPFRLDADLLHLNAFAKWTGPLGPGTLRASLLGYHADWTSTDQIPRRAIESGALSRLGFVDPDLGGETTRVGATLDWREDGAEPLALSTWLVYYRFALYSNFTYFLDDPEITGGDGDEFTQRDERVVWGGRAAKDLRLGVLGQTIDVTTGAETRLDVITDLGLFDSASRARRDTVRRDEVTEWSGALYAEAAWTPVDWMTWRAGVRGDLYVFDVDTQAGTGAFTNSGRAIDGLVSPKLSLVLRPCDSVELYLNGGGGFHSNDARGTTIRIDPRSGEDVDDVDPLARQWGAELGARWQPDERLHLTAALWGLRSESELVFVGDAGTTEAQGGSRRYGVELTGFLRPLPWLALDAAWSWSNADFTNTPSGEDRIPGAIETVATAGLTLTHGPFFGSLRVRHFGAYPLIEDNTQRAGGTTLVNLGTGVDWERFRLELTIVNLLDSKDSDIEYFYASRLEGEPLGGIEDVHLHPVAPRQVRVGLTARF